MEPKKMTRLAEIKQNYKSYSLHPTWSEIRYLLDLIERMKPYVEEWWNSHHCEPEKDQEQERILKELE